MFCCLFVLSRNYLLFEIFPMICKTSVPINPVCGNNDLKSNKAAGASSKSPMDLQQVLRNRCRPRKLFECSIRKLIGIRLSKDRRRGKCLLLTFPNSG